MDLKLAEALFELGGNARLDEVASLLERVVQRIKTGREVWPSHIFRAVVLSARPAARTGDLQLAAEEAQSALQIAQTANERPVFKRHPDLGKVPMDVELRRELDALAGGHPHS